MIVVVVGIEFIFVAAYQVFGLWSVSVPRAKSPNELQIKPRELLRRSACCADSNK